MFGHGYLYLICYPWWMHHVFAELKPVAGRLSESLFLFFHLLTYAGALAAVWFVERKLAHEGRPNLRRRMELLLALVVLIAVFVDTCVVAHLSHQLAAEEARHSIQETDRLTTIILSQPHQTSSLVICDQAITKIVSQIYSIIKNDFPEIGLTAVSLHLRVSHRHAGKIWNVVQVGRETKNREFLDLKSEGGGPGSLVAAALLSQPPRRVYCPDVNRAKQLGGDCTYYSPPTTETIDYTELACFPLKSAIGAPPFAGICIDGQSQYPWTERLNEIEQDLDTQASYLFSRLTVLAADDQCLFQN
jgi:hypothetical protein